MRTARIGGVRVVSMKKVAVIFLLAVFVPSLGLAWLALRSLQDQQFVLERQQALLYSAAAEALTQDINRYLTELQRGFALEVEDLLLKQEPEGLAPEFDERIRAHWPMAAVGFAVSLDGQLLAPPVQGREASRQFRIDNGLFLTGRQAVEVFWNTPELALNAAAQVGPAQVQGDAAQVPEGTTSAAAPSGSVRNYKAQRVQRTVDPQQAVGFQVVQQVTEAEPKASRMLLAEGDFRQLIGDNQIGTAARFLQNRLHLMFWYRPPRDPRLVFGAQLDLDRLRTELQPMIHTDAPEIKDEICLALLDETTRPVSVSHPGFEAVWKRPFVAAEIGEMLPHWEIGIYLLDPDHLSRSAHTLALLVGLVVATLVGAISAGGWLIVRDLRRELTLARQKTDFVSNVSHELKTPLTSIRMFAELMAEGRVAEAAKQRHYLGIITAEAARLTRLINNVLDFARMERGEKKYQFQPCDLGMLVSETLEVLHPHLVERGFDVQVELPEELLPIRADRDALAQVLVNLLSNAEKYSGEAREIRVEVARPVGPIPRAEVRVLDRGLGVPRGCEEKIFEKFYRAHDALNGGIQGSGLGLTLARQIARAHGGDLVYGPRDGGGSRFVLRLPLNPEA